MRNELKEHLAGTGLRAELSGVPVMQLEIRNAIERDRLIYNASGFAVGCLIAIVFFRRVSFMIIAAAPPLIAILLALGALGWLGFSLNMFLNVMTPLIMVISFSDSMQLTFAARDRLIAGDDKVTGLSQCAAHRRPGLRADACHRGRLFYCPAIFSSDLIRTFGEAGLIATAVALVAVLLGVPLLGVLLIRNEAEFVAAVRNMDNALDVLRRVCAWIAIRMVTRPGLYSLISLLVVGGLSLGYTQLQARFGWPSRCPTANRQSRPAIASTSN